MAARGEKPHLFKFAKQASVSGNPAADFNWRFSPAGSNLLAAKRNRDIFVNTSRGLKRPERSLQYPNSAPRGARKV
jgi:hypothetical protein